jgi:hypothetical protein
MRWSWSIMIICRLILAPDHIEQCEIMHIFVVNQITVFRTLG